MIWWGPKVFNLISFFFRMCSNSSLVKFEKALSDMITSGNPRVAKDFLIKEMVVAEVKELVYLQPLGVSIYH